MALLHHLVAMVSRTPMRTVTPVSRTVVLQALGATVEATTAADTPHTRKNVGIELGRLGSTKYYRGFFCLVQELGENWWNKRDGDCAEHGRFVLCIGYT